MTFVLPQQRLPAASRCTGSKQACDFQAVEGCGIMHISAFVHCSTISCCMSWFGQQQSSADPFQWVHTLLCHMGQITQSKIGSTFQQCQVLARMPCEYISDLCLVGGSLTLTNRQSLLTEGPGCGGVHMPADMHMSFSVSPPPPPLVLSASMIHSI